MLADGQLIECTTKTHSPFLIGTQKKPFKILNCIEIDRKEIGSHLEASGFLGRVFRAAAPPPSFSFACAMSVRLLGDKMCDGLGGIEVGIPEPLEASPERLPGATWRVR